MTHACPAWELVVDTRQRLQSEVLHITGKLIWGTPIRDMHMAFQIACVYDNQIIQATSTVIQNHEMQHWTGETRHRKCKRFKLGGGQAYDRSSFFSYPTLFAICTCTFRKLCKNVLNGM
jgi:hypothetical protein